MLAAVSLAIVVSVMTPTYLLARSMPVAYAAISGSHAAIWVAKEAGYFDKQGIDTDLIYLGGGQATKVLVSGSAPFISISGSAPITAAVQGADVTMLSCVLNTFIFSLMSKPEIDKPESLRGKKLGVSRFGAATDFALRYAIRQWNLDATKDLTVLQMGGVPEILAAIQAGTIDAGVLAQPTTLQAKKAGLRELVDLGNIGIEYPGSCIVTSKKYVRENRAETKNFLRAYLEGARRTLSDKAFASRVLAKYTRVSNPEVLEATYQDFAKYVQPIPRPTPAGVKLVLDQMVKSEPKEASVNPESLIDISILQELQSESGLLPLRRIQ
jgi:NitT/TauT family transport system substrate-binding protein